MTKVDNVVRKVTFKNDDDLYYQLDRFLLTDPELTGKNLHLKHIQMLLKKQFIAQKFWKKN